jgi:hypothetical protein
MEKAVRILYGHRNYETVEVTEIFWKHYPLGGVGFNELFGDPCHGVIKCLYFMKNETECLGTMLENSDEFIPYRKLVMGAIFKNESWILKEWLEHFMAEGVEHFYLINNNSTDDYMSVLQSYLDRGLVTLFHEYRSYIQVLAYNQYFMPYCHSAEWIIICDLDEFMYSRKGFGRIVDYLESLEKEISAVSVPWKMFGSSNWIEHPRDGVIRNFIYRKKYDGQGEFPIANPDNKSICCKTICRFHAISCLGMHNPELIGGHGITSDGKRVETMRSHQLINETILENSILHLNHYAIQSLEFFTKIKMTRTDAFSSSTDSVRTEEYFQRYDWNDICDKELTDKKNEE